MPDVLKCLKNYHIFGIQIPMYTCTKLLFFIRQCVLLLYPLIKALV